MWSRHRTTFSFEKRDRGGAWESRDWWTPFGGVPGRGLNALELLLRGVINMSVRRWSAGANVEVVHIFQSERRNVGGLRSTDVDKTRPFHIIQNEPRTQIVLLRANLDISHLDVLHVADEKPLGGHSAEHAGL